MGKRTLIIESRQTPEQPGYLDTIVLANNHLLWHGACSTCPNPTKPWPLSWVKWNFAYGWAACGSYIWECVVSKKHGKCLCINAGDLIPARAPNRNHDGRRVVGAVLVHRGWSATWRGSAGCITVPPAEWDRFMSFFAYGDTGPLNIIDYSKMNTTGTR